MAVHVKFFKNWVAQTSSVTKETTKRSTIVDAVLTQRPQCFMWMEYKRTLERAIIKYLSEIAQEEIARVRQSWIRQSQISVRTGKPAKGKK